MHDQFETQREREREREREKRNKERLPNKCTIPQVWLLVFRVHLDISSIYFSCREKDLTHHPVYPMRLGF